MGYVSTFWRCLRSWRQLSTRRFWPFRQKCLQQRGQCWMGEGRQQTGVERGERRVRTRGHPLTYGQLPECTVNKASAASSPQPCAYLLHCHMTGSSRCTHFLLHRHMTMGIRFLLHQHMTISSHPTHFLHHHMTMSTVNHFMTVSSHRMHFYHLFRRQAADKL